MVKPHKSAISGILDRLGSKPAAAKEGNEKKGVAKRIGGLASAKSVKQLPKKLLLNPSNISVTISQTENATSELHLSIRKRLEVIREYRGPKDLSTFLKISNYFRKPQSSVNVVSPSPEKVQSSRFERPILLENESTYEIPLYLHHQNNQTNASQKALRFSQQVIAQPMYHIPTNPGYNFDQASAMSGMSTVYGLNPSTPMSIEVTGVHKERSNVDLHVRLTF